MVSNYYESILLYFQGQFLAWDELRNRLYLVSRVAPSIYSARKKGYAWELVGPVPSFWNAKFFSSLLAFLAQSIKKLLF